MKLIDNAWEKFQALTPREKIIVTATVIVCIGGLWDTLFWTPFKQEQEELQLELSHLTQQLSAQQQAAQKLENGLTVDPNQINKNKLAELTNQLSDLQNQLVQEGQKFVPPQLMAQALNDILNQNQHLTLVKLDTLPVSTLNVEKYQFFPVYKHGLTLTFSGSYLDTLAYLKKLESLSWRINWDSIEYQVINHPVAETTIRGHTLSFEENWLDV
ncbi:MAG: hypothetical protein HOP23_09265 [Methylococcaceae bacterium]|nr:hypothetical protein [Methylococcaceae bacterium]